MYRADKLPGRYLSLNLQEAFQDAGARWVAQLPERLHFDLPDAFAGDVEVLANLFQGAFATVGIQTKAQTDHLLLAGAERLQDIAGNVSSIRVDDALRGTYRGLIFDEVTHLSFASLTNWSFQRNRLLNQVQRLTDFVSSSVHSLGDFFCGWFATHFDDQLTSDLLDLIDHFDHVNGNSNSPRLVGNRSSNGLTNPPGGVRRKLVPTPPIEFLHAFHQAKVSLLNQVQK